MKINKVPLKFVTLSLITVTVMHAEKLVTVDNTLPEITYNDMNTLELQIEVEKLSQTGNLPFEMGLALMQRWTKAK